MIYLKSNQANMKTNLYTVRITLWAVLGVAVLLITLAFDRTAPTAPQSTAIPSTATGTTSAEAETQDEVGSTDGIMIMAVLIVLIVIIPILLRRRAWLNGIRKRAAL